MREREVKRCLPNVSSRSRKDSPERPDWKCPAMKGEEPWTSRISVEIPQCRHRSCRVLWRARMYSPWHRHHVQPWSLIPPIDICLSHWPRWSAATTVLDRSYKLPDSTNIYNRILRWPDNTEVQFVDETEICEDSTSTTRTKPERTTRTTPSRRMSSSSSKSEREKDKGQTTRKSQIIPLLPEGYLERWAKSDDLNREKENWTRRRNYRRRSLDRQRNEI